MRNLKPAILPALFAAGIILLPATNAAAHESGYRNHGYPPALAHYRERHVRLPRWLRHDLDFRHWYRINYYRFRPDLSWHRLYRRYQRDYYYHRHYKDRHYRGHHHKGRYKKHKRKHWKKHRRHKRDRWYDDD